MTEPAGTAARDAHAKMDGPMLIEDEVVEAVCRHLEKNNYRIVGKCTARQRGVDVEAEHRSSGVTLRVEAKGETSSKSRTARYGKPFSGRQVVSHVSRAFYTAATMLDGPDGRVAMAFPDTPPHRERVRRIGGALERLQIGVFWVSAAGKVTLESAWTL